MHHALLLRRHGLAADGLDDQEHQPSAVQRGQRQQVDDAQVQRDDHHEIEDHAAIRLHDFAGHGHGADGAGHLIRTLTLEDQVAQRVEHELGDFTEIAPCFGNGRAQRDGLDAEGDADLTRGFAGGLVGDDQLGHERRGHGFAVAQHGQLHAFALADDAAQHSRAVGVTGDVGSVGGDYDVAGLQLGLRGGHVRHHGLNPRLDGAVEHAKHDHRRQIGQHKVYGRTGEHGQKPLPHGHSIHGVGRGIVVVLAHEFAVAAKGQHADGIVDALALPAEQLRPESDGKLHHADAAQAAHGKVAQLMDDDDDAEQHDGDENIQ